MARSLWIICLSALPMGQAAKQSCSYSFSNPKASFDLSSLYKETAPYVANDTYRYASDVERPFSYFFNVCGDVDEPDENDLCDHKGDSGPSAAAYQHVAASKYNNGSECFELGRAEATSWQYIDGDNAAVGVQLKYKQGTPCVDEPGTTRSFIIEFACVHEATALPFISTVYENDLCEYKVTMESIWGCPTECHSSSHEKVCAGHGICAVDTGTQAARCFCNGGFTGATCEEQSDKVKAPPTTGHILKVLTVFVIILLVLLLAISAVLYVRIKELNVNAEGYGALEDQLPHSAQDA